MSTPDLQRVKVHIKKDKKLFRTNITLFHCIFQDPLFYFIHFILGHMSLFFHPTIVSYHFPYESIIEYIFSWLRLDLLYIQFLSKIRKFSWQMHGSYETLENTIICILQCIGWKLCLANQIIMYYMTLSNNSWFCLARKITAIVIDYMIVSCIGQSKRAISLSFLRHNTHLDLNYICKTVSVLCYTPW